MLNHSVLFGPRFQYCASKARPSKKGTTMRNFAIATGAAGGLAAAALGLAAAEAPAPTGTGSATDVVTSLQESGYNVQLNGDRTAPLSQCIVLGVHPTVSEPAKPTEFTTVYFDISCPPRNNG